MPKKLFCLSCSLHLHRRSFDRSFCCCLALVMERAGPSFRRATESLRVFGKDITKAGAGSVDPLQKSNRGCTLVEAVWASARLDSAQTWKRI